MSCFFRMLFRMRSFGLVRGCCSIRRCENGRLILGQFRDESVGRRRSVFRLEQLAKKRFVLKL